VKRLAGSALMLLLALAVPFVPQSAAAAPTITTYSVATSPVPAKGYGMSLFLTETDGASTASLTITFSRTAATGRHPTQSHSYSFSLPAGVLDVAPKLAKASIHTGTGMGDEGAISMELKKLGEIQVTRSGCGTTKTRAGTLGGAFKLIADSTFFGTVKESSLPATLTKSVGTPGCGGSNPTCTAGTTLTSTSSKRHMFLNVSRTPNPSGGATVAETVSYVQSPTKSRPVNVSHSISVSGAPKKALDFSSDLTSASLNGSVGKPFLTGTLAFAGNPSPPGACSKALDSTISTGTVKGKLIAHFDSVGDRGFTGGKKVVATLVHTA